MDVDVDNNAPTTMKTSQVIRSNSTISNSNGGSRRSLGSSSGSSGSGDTKTPLNTRLLLKIGLAASVSFHFIWVGKQLSLLTAHGSYDELLISPEYTFEHGKSSNIPGSGGGSSSNNIWKPKPLPDHPTPNAELQELVSSHTPYNCPDGLIYVNDHILTDNITHPPDRKIPHLFHITAKSRCMTQAFVSNIDRWKKTLGSKYSIYIHDDDAVNKFIYERVWTEFPELKEVMSCVTAGVSLL